MVSTLIEPDAHVIVCTVCGAGFLDRHVVPEDFLHCEPQWLAPSLKTEGPHCGGVIKIVGRVYATRVADLYEEKAIK